MASIREDMCLISEEKILMLLQKVMSVLEENDVDYCMLFGALLGFIRKKRLIPWDTDIDLGTWDLDAILSLKNKFLEKDIMIVTDPNRPKWLNKAVVLMDKASFEDPAEYISIFNFYSWNGKPAFKYALRKNMLARIVNTIYHAINNNPYKLGKMSQNSMEKLIKIMQIIPCRKSVLSWLKKIDFAFCTKRVYIFPEIKTRSAEFYGIKIRIPSDPEKHLRLVYGDNWKTPDRDFSHEDIKNIYPKRGGVELWELTES